LRAINVKAAGAQEEIQIADSVKGTTITEILAVLLVNAVSITEWAEFDAQPVQAVIQVRAAVAVGVEEASVCQLFIAPAIAIAALTIFGAKIILTIRIGEVVVVE
jgi:hypothetical protein